jgi:hypothetical protein
MRSIRSGCKPLHVAAIVQRVFNREELRFSQPTRAVRPATGTSNTVRQRGVEADHALAFAGL